MDLNSAARTLDHMKTMPDNAKFTATSLSVDSGIPQPHVAAFLSRLDREGAICVVGKVVNPANNRSMKQYSIVDLSNITVMERRAPTVAPRSVSSHDNRKKVAQFLRAIAEEIEDLKSSITDFSTKELLREIERRTNG